MKPWKSCGSWAFPAEFGRIAEKAAASSCYSLGAMGMHFNRRQIVQSAAWLSGGLMLPPALRAQLPPPSVAHTDVAAMERDRILASAKNALKQPIITITSIPSPQQGADVHEFYSELTPAPDEKGSAPGKAAFRAHATALRHFSHNIATLTAAFLVSKEEAYALRAGQHLYAWFVAPETRMNPEFANAGCSLLTASKTGTPAGTLDAAPLAEVARAMSFLVDTAALSPPDLEAAHQWLAGFLDWMNTAKVPSIARDTKDHTASAWLLAVAAISRSLRDSRVLDACTHRFRKPTLRNQISANGTFPHEITTPFPMRNSLLNFDLLAGACQLLSTPFDPLWQYELEDGPGLRAAAALLYPPLRDRAKWPYVADPQFFRELPARRPALLFCGRAYDRPEYVELWKSLPTPDYATLPEPVAASMPIHEPLLWTARAAHGL